LMVFRGPGKAARDPCRSRRSRLPLQSIRESGARL
jgi:hypothetical protein